MGLRMVTPFHHPKSGVYYFRRAIPSDLKPVYGSPRQIKVSLGTRDPGVAKSRFAARAAQYDLEFETRRRAFQEGASARIVTAVRTYLDERDAMFAANLNKTMLALDEPGGSNMPVREVTLEPGADPASIRRAVENTPQATALGPMNREASDELRSVVAQKAKRSASARPGSKPESPTPRTNRNASHDSRTSGCLSSAPRTSGGIRDETIQPLVDFFVHGWQLADWRGIAAAVSMSDLQSFAGRRGTSYDVAREAGVSQSTVSRVFRAGASVADATRMRVVEAAARVGYRPNAIAASLITRRSHLVAVVISNLTNLHYPEVLALLTERLSAQGMRVLLFTLSTESEIDAVLDQVWRYRVDGAIVAARLSPAQETAFLRERVPLLLYNRPSGGGLANVVCCASEGGAMTMVSGLIAAGRRRFGLIAGPADSAVGEARVAGALAGLAAAGLMATAPIRGDYSHESGMQAMRALAALDPTVDAVVAANDVMAIGAIDVLRHELGARVPDDVAVVGFDGVAPASWPSYRLTTVRQPVEEMTAAAVNLLCAQIAEPDRPSEQRYFAGEMVPGATAHLG